MQDPFLLGLFIILSCKIISYNENAGLFLKLIQKFLLPLKFLHISKIIRLNCHYAFFANVILWFMAPAHFSKRSNTSTAQRNTVYSSLSVSIFPTAKFLFVNSLSINALHSGISPSSENGKSSSSSLMFSDTARFVSDRKY